MHAPFPAEKPHTERWAYRRLYSARIFELATRIYPLFQRSGAQAISRTVAWTYAVTQHAIRRIVRDNLALLRKEPVTEGDAISVFVNFGATIADYVAVGALPADEALAFCAESEGIEHLRGATTEGRGVILATGHFGFFEFGAVVLGTYGSKRQYRDAAGTLYCAHRLARKMETTLGHHDNHGGDRSFRLASGCSGHRGRPLHGHAGRPSPDRAPHFL